MSEMLGNQYFMARKYVEALNELEPILMDEPDNKLLKRKLIVCYTQAGNINKAVDLFLELIREDIQYIIDADPVKDDCPCPELVENLENLKDLGSKDFYTLAGILWLYCGLGHSLTYFEKALDATPHDLKLIEIVNILKSYQISIIDYPI